MRHIILNMGNIGNIGLSLSLRFPTIYFHQISFCDFFLFFPNITYLYDFLINNKLIKPCHPN